MTATYPNTQLTLFDRAKRLSDDGMAFDVVNVMNLAGVDDFFQDVPFQECNQSLQHRITRNTGMVDSENRKINQGTKSSKQNVQTIYEQTQMKERWRDIDATVLEGLTSANRAKMLKGEDDSHKSKLGQDVVKAFFNGAEAMVGLNDRLSALNPTTFNNVLSNGFTTGGSTTTRIFIVEWSIISGGGAYGIYPAATGDAAKTMLGVFAKDWGFKDAADPNDSTRLMVRARAQFQAWVGLAVENNAKIGCIANINPSMTGANNFSDGCVQLLMQLIEEGQFNPVTSRIYVNTRVKAQMNCYAEAKNNVNWGTTEIFGRPVKTFLEIPIRTLDKAIITNTQAVIS